MSRKLIQYFERLDQTTELIKKNHIQGLITNYVHSSGDSKTSLARRLCGKLVNLGGKTFIEVTANVLRYDFSVLWNYASLVDQSLGPRLQAHHKWKLFKMQIKQQIALAAQRNASFALHLNTSEPSHKPKEPNSPSAAMSEPIKTSSHLACDSASAATPQRTSQPAENSSTSALSSSSTLQASGRPVPALEHQAVQPVEQAGHLQPSQPPSPAQVHQSNSSFHVQGRSLILPLPQEHPGGSIRDWNSSHKEFEADVVMVPANIDSSYSSYSGQNGTSNIVDVLIFNLTHHFP